jgi:hypothetical protein
VSTAALTALTNGTGGYLLLSGILSPSIDDAFRLAKYFLQILAGVTNNTIVTDPVGQLGPGMTARIPFILNETDIDATVILLTDLPVVRMRVETPAGDLMDPTTAVGLGATYEVGRGVSFYRFTLPLPLGSTPAQSGTWHALLDIDPSIYRQHTHALETSVAAWSSRMAHGVRYCVTVQSYSNLRMEARLAQNGMVPGSNLYLGATLSEYGIPVAHRASVRADLQRPDGVTSTLTLGEVQDGVFEGTVAAPIEGVYRFHVLANGTTMRGFPFTRDRLLTGAVFVGGNNPSPTSEPAKDSRLCDLLECLLERGALDGFMEKFSIDPDGLRRCLAEWCRARRVPSEAEIREREGTSATVGQPVTAATGGLTEQIVETLTRMLAAREPTIGTKSEKQQARRPSPPGQ